MTATPPRGSRLVAVIDASVNGSVMSSTGAPSSFSSSRTTGARENSGDGPFFGRPKCDMSMTRAPWSRRNWIVGSAARIRVLSVTTPVLHRTVEVDPHQRALPIERALVLERRRGDAAQAPLHLEPMYRIRSTHRAE